jgi:hypothetical protein
MTTSRGYTLHQGGLVAVVDSPEGLRELLASAQVERSAYVEPTGIKCRICGGDSDQRYVDGEDGMASDHEVFYFHPQWGHEVVAMAHDRCTVDSNHRIGSDGRCMFCPREEDVDV